MIVVNLDVMLAKRKMSVTELSQQVGITMANLSILKNGKSKAIRLSTLDAICEALQCQPGEILEWQPGGAVQPDLLQTEEMPKASSTPQEEVPAAAEKQKQKSLQPKNRPAAKPKYLTVDTNGSRLNLRDRDSRSGAVVARLPSGAQVELLEQRGQWTHIRWEDKDGWVLAAYLKERN